MSVLCGQNFDVLMLELQLNEKNIVLSGAQLFKMFIHSIVSKLFCVCLCVCVQMLNYFYFSHGKR